MTTAVRAIPAHLATVRAHFKIMAMDQIASLKSLDTEARQLVAACYAVAMADLEMGHGERTLPLCICQVLGVDPAAAGLVEPA